MSTSVIKNEADLKSYLDKFEIQLAQEARAFNLANFNYYARIKSSKSFTNLNSAPFFNNSDCFQLIKEWLPQIKEAQLHRRLLMLYRIFTETSISQAPLLNQLREDLNFRLMNFQPTVDGRNIKRSLIWEMLRSSPDRFLRKRLMEQGLGPLSKLLAPRVQELMRLRNLEAVRCGYPNYVELQLALSGLKQADLFALFNSLEASTDKLYLTLLTKACVGTGTPFPPEIWDLNYLVSAQTSLPKDIFTSDKIIGLVKDFVANFGLDTNTLPIKLVMQEVPFGGLCYSISIPDDIRILANPKDGYSYFRTLLHEYGHALHGVFNKQEYYSLKHEPGVFNEAMAETFAYFTHYSEWLKLNTRLDVTTLDKFQSELTFRRLLRLRTMLAQSCFEFEAYLNPFQDLDFLYARLESRYLKVPLNLTPRWAASSFPITHPVYRQNYILADMIAIQTHNTLINNFGNFWLVPATKRTEIFKFLIENYYAPGAGLDWQTKVENLTGRKLQGKFPIEQTYSDFYS